MSKKTKLPEGPNVFSNQEQTEAYLFVGKFISQFAEMEFMIDRFIMGYFMVHPSLNPEKADEISDKNTSIFLVMEYSILNSPSFNFQAKHDLVKAVMQERTSDFYTKHGKSFFRLVKRLQDLRNLVAHHKTYVDDGKIMVSKPIAGFSQTRGNTEKGGRIPDVVGNYEPSYKTAIITEDLKNRISNQLSGVLSFLAKYQGTNNYHFDIYRDQTFEQIVETYSMFKGGVFDIKILD